MLEDKILAWRFKKGSRAALRRIYEKYYDYLLTVATALLHDVNAAEDVVHDSFLKLSESAHLVNPRRSLKWYLVVCVSNRARDKLRGRRYEGVDLDASLALPSEAGGTVHGMAFRGPEGGVEVRWGIIPSYECTGELTTVQTGKCELSACYVRQADGTEVWDEMRKPLTPTIALCGRAYTNDATQASRDVVLRVLSMWSLPEAKP